MNLDPNLPKTLEEYKQLEKTMKGLTQREVAHMYRVLGMTDLYFLLRYILTTRDWQDETKTRSFWEHQWLLDRCRDVQFDSENVLNIWARYHGKSTIQTFGENIRALLVNPNETIGIFSVTSKVADKFVARIKREFETNELLISLYPDRVYTDPNKEAPIWTVEKGFTIRRDMNLVDPSVCGYGLLDSNYTGARVSRANYDDAVNEKNVTTAEMIEKTVEAWELSMNTGFPGCKRFYIGTFYAHGDAYHTMAERGLRLRIYPCYEIDHDNSTFDDCGLPQKMEFNRDKPTLFSKEYLQGEEKTQSAKTFGIQMLCYPMAGQEKGFKHEWLKFYSVPAGRVRQYCNVVITVDPASEKKKHSSRTAMWVIGLGRDENFYILDGIIDRLNLSERTNALFDLVQRWKKRGSHLEVRYEKYSFQADVEHIRYVMEHRNYRFNIIEVGGHLSKDDRIERLIPYFENGRVWLPQNIYYRNREGETIDLIDWWVRSEYRTFPVSVEKDGLDSLSRICEQDIPLRWPGPVMSHSSRDTWRRALHAEKSPREGRTWMSA